jgi:hypothetical protein
MTEHIPSLSVIIPQSTVYYPATAIQNTSRFTGWGGVAVAVNGEVTWKILMLANSVLFQYPWSSSIL